MGHKIVEAIIEDKQIKYLEPLAKVFHITLHYGSISVLYQTFQVLGGL